MVSQKASLFWGHVHFTMETNMTLMLHTGGQAIAYGDLRDLSTPDPTASHVPIPHHSVVDMVRYAPGYFDRMSLNFWFEPVFFSMWSNLLNMY